MYYLSFKNKELLGYKINIDEEKLKELREEIIEKCSIVIFTIKEVEKPLEWENDEHIRNYKQVKVDMDKNIDERNDYYIVQYDYYQFPDLVNYVDMLLNNDIKAISLIKRIPENIYQLERKLNKQKQLIFQKSKEENANMLELIDELFKIDTQLAECYKNKTLTQKQLLEISFKKKVLECIQIEKTKFSSKKIDELSVKNNVLKLKKIKN